MTILLAAAVLALITVHMIDGRIIEIAPGQITQMLHPPKAGKNKALVAGVNCVIRLTDGSFVSIAETCAEVQAKIGN